MIKLLPAAALAACGLALAACEPTLEAPMDTGVCFHVAVAPDGKQNFNVVARNVPDIEHCAAQLEGMRLRFLRLGGQTRELSGSYQGSFIFLRRDGIYRAQSWDGNQYLMLVRSGDGRLVQPGAVG